MENNVVHNLREWAPLTVLEKIPTSVLHGFFPNDLNITCIDAISEFLALGTDDGLIFWYNRNNSEFQRLRIEVSSPITCIKIVSSVEYMIASGTRNDQVTIFQIQKEIPPDLKLSAPIARSKPIQRYTVKDLHKASITCLEWSKNGMKLFSADKSGIVVLTEFDYQNNAAKSTEILNERYSVIQLSLFQSYLLVSTLQRAVVCEVDRSKNSSEWRISQIGKTDRKALGEFGAAFKVEDLKPPNIIACRPGFRFWLANCEGIVEKTFIFKDAPLIRPTWEIPLLNPNRKSTNIRLKNFTRIYPYLKKFFITNDDVSLYILNLEELKIEAIARNFRNIVDYAICGNEIFVLEGGRSLIRLSNKPEPPNHKATIIFNPLLPPPIPHMGIFEAPIEFTEDENIIGAEECFELPPMEPINLDIQIQTHINSPDTETKKLVEENHKRIEILQKIGQEAFEKEILFQSAKKNKMISNQKTKKSKLNNAEGIIEIGCTAMEIFKKEDPNLATLINNSKKEVVEYDEKPKENLWFDTMTQINDDYIENLKSEQTANSIDEISELALEKPLLQRDEPKLQLPQWPPLNYPISTLNMDPTVSSDCLTNESVRLVTEKIELLENEHDSDETSVNINNELSLIQSDKITSTQDLKIDQNVQITNLNNLPAQLGGRGNLVEINKDMLDDLKIPPIFNSQNENFQNQFDTGGSDSNGSHSEWEFVNDDF
ncbi:WD repeat-containing protein CG11141 isoform X2 [Condylostylus longicornis]|uniref:WD repeat-containing protein CG11141 isoform X2 n=1 Tax=Condylostylus longicornis TaxID=2530218 RepID=UPI00244E549D|nr:WD repeat-containing protein CG11141 isoform X2 [Condylostylus longicornis]